MGTHKNKKNIVNDKEKTKEALELLNKLIENNEKKGSEWRRSENSLISIIYTDQIKELEDLKKILNTLTDEKGIEYVWTTEEIEETQLETRQERALEKGEKVLELIDKLLWNISDSKERWINTSVNHEAFNTPKQFSILMEKAIFLGIVIRDLGNMKRTLEK